MRNQVLMLSQYSSPSFLMAVCISDCNRFCLQKCVQEPNTLYTDLAVTSSSTTNCIIKGKKTMKIKTILLCSMAYYRQIEM